MMLVLALLTVIVLVSLAAVSLIEQHSSNSSRGLKSAQTRYAARAGLNQALLKLSQDHNWDPGTFTLPNGDTTLVQFLDSNLGAEVTVLNNYLGTTPVPAPDGSTLAPGRVWLRSQGTLGGRVLTHAAGLAKAIAAQPDVKFDHALNQRAGVLNMTGLGVQVSSYSGNYATSAGTFGDAAIVRGELGVTAGGGSSVAGMAEVPRAGLPLAGSFSLGTQVVAKGPLTLRFTEPRNYQSLPHPTPSGSGLDLMAGPYGGVNASGTLTLHEGVYYFESLTLAANTTINLVGATPTDPCVVYIGTALVTGPACQLNPGGEPRLLQIYSTDSDNNGFEIFDLGAATFCSAVFASKSMILQFGVGATLYGAADCRWFLWNNNARVIFDEALIGQVLEGEPEWVMVGENG